MHAPHAGKAKAKARSAGSTKAATLSDVSLAGKTVDEKLGLARCILSIHSHLHACMQSSPSTSDAISHTPFHACRFGMQEGAGLPPVHEVGSARQSCLEKCRGRDGQAHPDPHQVVHKDHDAHGIHVQ